MIAARPFQASEFMSTQCQQSARPLAADDAGPAVTAHALYNTAVRALSGPTEAQRKIPARALTEVGEGRSDIRAFSFTLIGTVVEPESSQSEPRL